MTVAEIQQMIDDTEHEMAWECRSRYHGQCLDQQLFELWEELQYALDRDERAAMEALEAIEDSHANGAY